MVIVAVPHNRERQAFDMLLNFPLSFDSFSISESKFSDFSARLAKENASDCYQIESCSIDLVSKAIATLNGSHGFLICANRNACHKNDSRQ